MKKPRTMRIVSLLTALALLIALGAAYMAFGYAKSTEDAEADISKKLNCVSSSFKRINQIRAQLEHHYDDMLMGNVRLSVWLAVAVPVGIAVV